MGWYGYESTGQEKESRTPICQVVMDLFDTRPGGSAVSIRMGDADGDQPDSQQDREALAEVLQRELEIGLKELLLS
jgi:hypothetical protein